MGLRLRLVRTLDEFTRLREPWNHLVAQSDAADVWMTHEWFRCWLQHFGDPAGLAILTGWRDGQLVAAAPMHIVREKRRGLPFRTLTFLASAISPPCNFLIEDRGDPTTLFDGILALDGWDVLETRDLDDAKRATGQWVEYLAGRRDLPYRLIPAQMRPFISTEAGWERYWASLSRSFRIHLKRGVGRLEKAESFTVERVDEHEAFVRVFGELVETSARSWKGSQGTDLKSRPNLQAFLLAFGAAFVDPAPFEAWILRIGGTMAAFDYYIRSGRTLALMRTDFDADFGYYSPGNGLRYHILTDLFARDAVWGYDMGGHARGYKLDWTTRTRQHQTVAVPRGVYGRLVVLLKHSTRLRRLAALAHGTRQRAARHGRVAAADPGGEDAAA
jgi:hypothetical protein